MKKFIISLIFVSLQLGCSDARMSKFKSMGKRAEAVCMSGEVIQFHGISTGQVLNEEKSDGFYAVWNIIEAKGFKHLKSLKNVPVTISSNCIIAYIDQ